MAIQKVRGSSMNLAMQRAKTLFVDDPLILDSKTVIVDGKNFYELTVSGDKKKEQDSDKENISVKKNAQKILQLVNNYNIEDKIEKTEIVKDKTIISNNQNIDENIKYIEQLFNFSYQDILSIPNKLKPYFKILISQNISFDLAFSIIDALKEEGAEDLSHKDIMMVLYAIIKDNLTVSKNLYQTVYDQRVVALIGTAGVGKTTTLAKIASEGILSYGKKTAFFTFDIYKTSTVEHIKSIASLLKIPFELIHSKDEFEKKLYKKYSNYDLILLDTEGINIFDKYQFNTLEHLLSYPPNIEKHLVLPTNMNIKDMERVYKKFKNLTPDYLIFSKMDETQEYGSIFNMSVKTDIPISFLTNGTHIPGDLMMGTKNRVAKMVIDSINKVLEG